MTRGGGSRARERAGLSIENRIAAAALITAVAVLLAASVVFCVAQYQSGVMAEARAQAVAAAVGRALPAGGPEPSVALPQAIAVCSALFFAAAGLALVLSRILARRIVEPLDRLAGVMQALTGEGGLHARAAMPANAPQELSRLSASFNALLDRLQAHEAALTEARDAAQAANVLKSQFLANMSHEIRTPLNGVLAMTQLMDLGPLEAPQRARLAVVRQSGEALLKVLNDVLDVSKIEAGRLELEDAPFDLAATVRGACDAFSAVMEDKGLALHLDVAPEAVGLRRGDEARVRQVVLNLVSNAVKFTRAGSVSVAVDGVGADGREGVRIRVGDTGQGLIESELPHLFDKFTQGDSSVTRRFGGTGLGLAICRELVGLMGGEIAARSTPGEGAVFEVTAPLAAVAAPAAAAPTPATVAPAGQRRLRVLAAEDNATNRTVLASIMAVFDVELELVSNGALAVEAWRTGAPDAILMDVQMPEMDGVTATRAIRAEEAASRRPRTPIVALSANAMTHQVRDYLAAGMDAHVPKPIEIGRLQATLEAVLDAGAEATRVVA